MKNPNMMGSDEIRLHDDCSDGRRPWTGVFLDGSRR
jgi:hypothetical protein